MLQLTEHNVHEPSIAQSPAICKTGRCSLERLEGGSKVNHNIGIFHFWVNRLKRSRPQYIVVLDNERNGKFNFDRMTYVAHMSDHGFSRYLSDMPLIY